MFVCEYLVRQTPLFLLVHMVVYNGLSWNHTKKFTGTDSLLYHKVLMISKRDHTSTAIVIEISTDKNI